MTRVKVGLGGRAGWGWAAVLVVACGGVVNEGNDRAADGGRTTPRDAAVISHPTCGNGRIDPGEVCDGKNLAGNTCESATMNTRRVGTLGCSASCTSFVTTGCQVTDPVPGSGGAPAGAGGAPSGGGGAGRGGSDAGWNDAGLDGSAGATYGDPHLFTADGVEYDFQAVGEFVFMEDRDDPSFVVQVRQERFKPFTTLSSNTAVAALVGEDRVAVRAGVAPEISVEGIPRDVERELALPHGGRVVREDRVFTLAWPTGERLVVNAASRVLLNLRYVPSLHGKARRLHGLIGTPDGDPHNEFVTRQGAQLAAHLDGNALYDTFGLSYRITPAESLFDYAPGEDTSTFTDAAFPRGDRRAAALSPASLRAAYLTCVVAGVADVAALEACTRDVAATGDPEFARAAAAMTPVVDPASVSTR